MFTRGLVFLGACCALICVPCFAGTLTLDFESPDLPVEMSQLDGHIDDGHLVSYQEGRGVGFMFDFSGEMRLVSAVIYTTYPLKQFAIGMGTSADACLGSDTTTENFDVNVYVRWPFPSDLQCAQTGGMSFGVLDIPDNDESLPYELWIDDVVIEYTGDTNMSGYVDTADLNNVRNWFGESGENIPGDDNGDGTVNIPDLVNVRNFFGAGPIGGSQPIPEPSTFVLGLIAAAFTMLRIGRASTPRSR